MSQLSEEYYYNPKEELLNVYSHGIGFIFSVIGSFFLIRYAVDIGTYQHVLSATIFGLSLCVLYAASTIYHSRTEYAQRRKMRIFDHASIYVLIAGSYTPFALISLDYPFGTILLCVIWAMAVFGICIKLFFTGKYDTLSTIMYVVMGWTVILFINPLIENFSGPGLWWLFVGGVSYTVGAIIYSIEKIPYNHAVFHLFVMLGSYCHFHSVYWYLLPI